MRYLLDTNACVDYLNGSYPHVVRRIQSSDPADLCVSAVVVAELRYGAERSAHRRRNHARIDTLLGDIACLPFGADAARTFGAVRSQLEKGGKVIGPYDMQIAAHALCLDLVVVTDNIAEFSRVVGLAVENWRQA